MLLTYGTACALLAGDAEPREEEYSQAVRARGLKLSSTFRNYTHSEPRFCVLLTEGASELELGVGLAVRRPRPARRTIWKMHSPKVSLALLNVVASAG
jgi:hypothetical protein